MYVKLKLHMPRSPKKMQNKVLLCRSNHLFENWPFSHTFDVLIDSQSGGGSINTTHMVAFQYPNENSTYQNKSITVQRRKSRQLFIEDVNINTIPVNKKKEPPSNFAVRAEITPKKSISTVHS